MSRCFSWYQARSDRFGSAWCSVWGIVALAVLLIYADRPAVAQVLFGSVVGNVSDTTGASVPGATVGITEVSTNESRTVQTNEQGAYTVSTVPAGTYRVEISKEGFRRFAASNILVNQNNVVRVDAQLQLGTQSERVDVSAESAVLQTDRADVHSEIATHALENLPQANRTYQGLLALVPGISPPAGQLAGGTNNPSKSMQFAANGTGTYGANVRIEGVSATNPWSAQNTTFVPSVEAIANVNVVTNSPDAEQGQAGGASVNVMLKGGSNQTHGAAFLYNIVSAFEANNFFALPGSKPPHLVDNNTGGSLGGHVIKDKLFYFGSYEGDFDREANSGVLSFPNQATLHGDMTGSANSIYDPATGNPDGTGRTPFPGKIIPQNRVSPVVQKLIPHFPVTNLPGVVNNNYVNQATVYNLHKIDTKVDYNATSNLRLSGRWGYQPYYNLQEPVYGQVLGGASAFPQAQAGNYLQHGATMALSVSATYVASPTFIVDATFGVTQAHQLLFPTQADVKYGSDVLGIPNTNLGKLPWAGGMPNFSIANFVELGASYTPLEYKDPIFEYTANATKIKGAHNIRFGFDISRQHQNHIEVSPTNFTFSGGVTSLKGGPNPNPYNSMSDFLLGLPQSMQNAVQVPPFLTKRLWQDSVYVRDQWQVNRKLTVNYGVRWEYYPVPTEKDNGVFFYDFAANKVLACGVGPNPIDCDIHVSKKLFAPSVGIAWRPFEKFVVRMGGAISPSQYNMYRSSLIYPDLALASVSGPNSYTAAGSLTTGAPIVPIPNFINPEGAVTPPPGTGNLYTDPQNFVRGYIESWNVTIQREFLGGITGQVGYVGTHAVHMDAPINENYGRTLGGGAASQLLYPVGIVGTVSVHEPAVYAHYNALQASAQKRMSNGLAFQASYTWSHQIGLCCGGENVAPSILIPQYQNLAIATMPMDVTHNFHLAGTYEVPFGKDKRYLQHGVLSAIAGGWSVNAIFAHVSGLPFSVSDSNASLNAPGNTQRADLVKANVDKVGNGVGGQAYFDPLAFAPVRTPRFGTAGFDTLRGPGNNNLDMGLFRNFAVTERVRLQIRAESINVSNTPHFANPGANVSNMSLNNDGTVRSLGGFSQISSTRALGRLIDQRYFRFGLRFMF